MTQTHIELIRELLSNTQYRGFFGSKKKKNNENGLIDIGTRGLLSKWGQKKQELKLDRQEKLEQSLHKVNKKLGWVGDEKELKPQQALLQQTKDEMKNKMNAERLRKDAEQRMLKLKNTMHNTLYSVEKLTKDVEEAYRKMSDLKNCEDYKETAVLKDLQLCKDLKTTTDLVEKKLAEFHRITQGQGPPIEKLYAAMTGKPRVTDKSFTPWSSLRAAEADDIKKDM